MITKASGERANESKESIKLDLSGTLPPTSPPPNIKVDKSKLAGNKKLSTDDKQLFVNKELQRVWKGTKETAGESQQPGPMEY